MARNPVSVYRGFNETGVSLRKDQLSLYEKAQLKLNQTKRSSQIASRNKAQQAGRGQEDRATKLGDSSQQNQSFKRSGKSQYSEILSHLHEGRKQVEQGRGLATQPSKKVKAKSKPGPGQVKEFDFSKMKALFGVNLSSQSYQKRRPLASDVSLTDEKSSKAGSKKWGLHNPVSDPKRRQGKQGYEEAPELSRAPEERKPEKQEHKILIDLRSNEPSSLSQHPFQCGPSRSALKKADIERVSEENVLAEEEELAERHRPQAHHFQKGPSQAAGEPEQPPRPSSSNLHSILNNNLRSLKDKSRLEPPQADPKHFDSQTTSKFVPLLNCSLAYQDEEQPGTQT
mmetsp:Transcript_7999/g.13422  ORF Transcript_7999/g.13422 Transcript_7999/m.13422 type:complete len:341 (+) Transcript_7999:451-1473(+)